MHCCVQGTSGALLSLEHPGQGSIVGLGLLQGYNDDFKMKLPPTGNYFKKTATKQNIDDEWRLPICATISNKFVDYAKTQLKHMQNFRLYEPSELPC